MLLCAGCLRLVIVLIGLPASAAHLGLLLPTVSGRRRGFMGLSRCRSLLRIAGCVWPKAGATLLILILHGVAL